MRSVVIGVSCSMLHSIPLLAVRSFCWNCSARFCRVAPLRDHAAFISGYIAPNLCFSDARKEEKIDDPVQDVHHRIVPSHDFWLCLTEGKRRRMEQTDQNDV